MNPDSKMFLKEMRKEIRREFAEQDTKWESRFAAIESKKDERVDALEQAAQEFASWKPTIESSVQIVKTEVQKLSKHWERSVKDKTVGDPGLFPHPQGSTPLQGTTSPPPPLSVPPRPSAGGDADGPDGHRNRQWNQDFGVDDLHPDPEQG